MACVGIVGGRGVGATVHFYESIVKQCKARGVVPDLVIIHADVDYGQSLVRARKLDELAGYLASFIDRLARAGAVAARPACSHASHLSCRAATAHSIATY
jgi:aspartate racemase